MHPLYTTTEQAYQMGQRAYRDGKPHGANPWPDGRNATGPVSLKSKYSAAERNLAEAWQDGYYFASTMVEKGP